MKEYKTYCIRLFPDREQSQQLRTLASARNTLYNILIDIEQRSFEQNQAIKSEYDLDKEITILRKLNSSIASLNSKACQRLAKEIYGSYKSFFQLRKKSKNVQPPQKINDTGRFHTIVYNQSGWVFISDSLVKVNGIPLKYKGMPGINYKDLQIKEVKLKLVNNKYLLDLGAVYEIKEPERLEVENKVLALDLGIEKLASGVDNTGRWVTIPNKAKKINDYFYKEISKIQKKLSRCQKGSRRYRKLKNTLRRLYVRKNAQVKQTLHIQSKKLSNMNYKTIVVGDLQVKKLMEKEDNKKDKMSRSFGRTAVSRFMEYLTYKCRARHTEVETIGEQWTTQLNCLTGKLFKERVEIKDRVVQLSDSIMLDRDLNAAVNILKRYEQNHIALLTAPLDISSVVNRYNLLTNTKIL